MTDFEKACQKLPENGPNSKLSKCQVFEISYKSNEWGKREILFLRAFSKNVLKRQIIFHLASGNKMSEKLPRFNREGKTVVFQKDNSNLNSVAHCLVQGSQPNIDRGKVRDGIIMNVPTCGQVSLTAPGPWACSS